MKVKEIDEVEEYTYFYLGCLAEDQGNYEEALVLYQLCL
jgi:lipoprotein NlpI